MTNKNSKIKLEIALVIVVILIVIFLGWSWQEKRSPYKEGALDNFARCLAAKNFVMYGAYWCPHCQNEKAAFGSSFKYIPYVECTKEVQKCLDAKIEGYPTWIIGGEKRLMGEQGLARLSSISGCPLPPPK